MKISKVLTVTLNPSLDITMWVDDLHEEFVNNITNERTDAGGKSINVSRALKLFGVPNKAFILAGEENSDMLLKLLDEEAIDYYMVKTKGRIRENYTLIDHGRIRKLNKKGTPVELKDYDHLMDEVLSSIDDETVLVISGSLPSNLNVDHLYQFTQILNERNIPYIIDTKSINRNETIKLSPFMIKPNLEEFIKLTGIVPKSNEEIIEAARGLIERGVKNILLSLGENGIMLLNDAVCMCAKVPNVEAKSTVGAGDSSIAGFLYGIYHQRGIEDCLKYAASFGTASVLKEGTTPPDIKDVEQIFEDVAVKRIDFAKA